MSDKLMTQQQVRPYRGIMFLDVQTYVGEGTEACVKIMTTVEAWWVKNILFNDCLLAVNI